MREKRVVRLTTVAHSFVVYSGAFFCAVFILCRFRSRPWNACTLCSRATCLMLMCIPLQSCPPSSFAPYATVVFTSPTVDDHAGGALPSSALFDGCTPEEVLTVGQACLFGRAKRHELTLVDSENTAGPYNEWYVPRSTWGTKVANTAKGTKESLSSQPQ